MDQTRMECWKIILFVNHFLSNLWDHKTVMENLDISSCSTVDWRFFCSEVCDNWLQNQDPIGGQDIEVEIDETLIVRRKYNRARTLSQIWLFGGIERNSKQSFVVALTDPNEQKNKETLLRLIRKFVLPGSIIYSDS